MKITMPGECSQLTWIFHLPSIPGDVSQIPLCITIIGGFLKLRFLDLNPSRSGEGMENYHF